MAIRRRWWTSSTVLVVVAGLVVGAYLIGHSTAPKATSNPNQVIDVAVPVVECPTVNAQNPSPPARFPSAIGLALPRHLAKSFDFYSDSVRSYVPILGPRGWQCSFGFSTDGSIGITINPLGSSPEQIRAYNTGAATGEALFTACPYFPSATSQLLREGQRCPESKPHDERVASAYGVFVPSTINGGTVEFREPSQPAGTGRAAVKYPAVGLVEFSGVPQPIPSTIFEVCVLPATESDLCTAIASQFLTGNWGSAPQ